MQGAGFINQGPPTSNALNFFNAYVKWDPLPVVRTSEKKRTDPISTPRLTGMPHSSGIRETLNLGTPVVPFYPFCLGVSLFKQNSRKKGSLNIYGLLGNLETLTPKPFSPLSLLQGGRVPKPNNL